MVNQESTVQILTIYLLLTIFRVLKYALCIRGKTPSNPEKIILNPTQIHINVELRRKERDSQKKRAGGEYVSMFVFERVATVPIRNILPIIE